jgi:glycine/D-amino acid oxidase-like deaminating enzyme
MRLAYDAPALARAEAWMPTAEAHGLDTRILTPREVSQLLPHYAGPGCLGGMFTASDGCAEPEKVSPAFAAAARRAGATVLEHCAAQAIETRNGRASGVHTERGHVAADAVVCASGAWTSRLLRPLGVFHPSLWVRGSVAQTEPIGMEIRKLVVWGKCAYRQRPDTSLTLAPAEDGYHDVMIDSLRYGRWFLGLARQNWRNLHFALGRPIVRDLAGEFASFTTHRTLDPPPDPAGLERAVKAFAVEYPSAPPLRLRRSWAGWIDYMPDELPVIDELAAPRGLFVAAGLSGHGFGLGPIVGKTISSLISDGRSEHDLSSFRAGRFT